MKAYENVSRKEAEAAAKKKAVLDTLEAMYRCSSKSDKEKDAYVAINKHCKSFYADADPFTESKRFERFMDIFEDHASEFIKQLEISMMNSEDKRMQRTYDTSFCESIKKVVKAHIYTKYIETERQMPEDWLSLCDLYGDATLKPFSVLKEVVRLLKEADSFDKELLICCVGAAFTNEQFSSIYYQAICHACYDYVCFQAVEKDLTSENWFKILKELDCHQTFRIIIKTFEYTVSIVEDSSALRMIHNYHMNEDTVSKLLLKTITMKKELDELDDEMCQQQAAISAKGKEVRELKQANAELQRQLDTTASDIQERAKLQKKLKEEQERNRQLQEKVDSMQEYISLLTVKEDPETAPELPESDPSMYADRRIVFVRDKKNENYILMKRLAERFPNAKFTNVIASDIDIKTTDLVVQLIQYQGHSTYWKASGIAKRNNIPILVSTYANFDAITKQICNAFSEKEG